MSTESLERALRLNAKVVATAALWERRKSIGGCLRCSQPVTHYVRMDGACDDPACIEHLRKVNPGEEPVQLSWAEEVRFLARVANDEQG